MLTAMQIRNIVQGIDIKDELGSGMFSVVTERRCGTKVAKVSAEDKGYIAFLDFVGDHPESVIMPKIYAQHLDGDSFFVVMEKLYPLDYDDKRIFRFARDAYDYGAFVDKCEAKHVKKRATDLIPREAFWILKDVKDSADSYGVSTDMHADNAMIRKRHGDEPDRLVITDPYYYSSYRLTLHDMRVEGALSASECYRETCKFSEGYYICSEDSPCPTAWKGDRCYLRGGSSLPDSLKMYCPKHARMSGLVAVGL